MRLIMKKFAVIGNPIAHSRSPDIHAAFAASCGIELSYERVLCELDGFVACVADLRAAGFGGANVTVPFKLDAFACADSLSDAARWAGAVNTLILNDKIQGDNTDGVGLVRDITVNLSTEITGKSIVLLGAGGAARGILYSILSERPNSLLIINRNKEKAQEWLNQVKKIEGFDEILGDCVLHNVQPWNPEISVFFDVVINATSSGLNSTFTPPCKITPSHGALAYDMMYGKQTAFLDWASSNGARTADGWGMLVEQAAKSFEIWHGVAPDTRSLIASKGQ